MNNEKIDISVIIPVYNGAKWVEKCFESILIQETGFFRRKFLGASYAKIFGVKMCSRNFYRRFKIWRILSSAKDLFRVKDNFFAKLFFSLQFLRKKVSFVV